MHIIENLPCKVSKYPHMGSPTAVALSTKHKNPKPATHDEYNAFFGSVMILINDQTFFSESLDIKHHALHFFTTKFSICTFKTQTLQNHCLPISIPTSVLSLNSFFLLLFFFSITNKYNKKTCWVFFCVLLKVGD